jgi:hypothetical protein
MDEVLKLEINESNLAHTQILLDLLAFLQAHLTKLNPNCVCVKICIAKDAKTLSIKTRLPTLNA